MKRLIAAAAVGAIICMIWGTLSWMVMSWHSQGIHRFSDETAVKKMLLENAPEPGLYMLPDITPSTDRTRQPSPKAAREMAETARKTGPYLHGVIRTTPGGMDMPESLGYAFGRSLIASLLVALLLNMTARLDFMQRVLFCTLCGAFAGVVADFPMYVWFEYPLRYTLVNMADHLMEWFLVGLAMAGIVTGKDL